MFNRLKALSAVVTHHIIEPDDFPKRPIGSF
jgi:hypothetical protein